MDSPPAPLIANCWMSKFDSQIKDDALLYERYMDDDILRNINKSSVHTKSSDIKNLHPSLKFTIEEETANSISFLDMKMIRSENTLMSTWFTKKSDTGLTMDFH